MEYAKKRLDEELYRQLREYVYPLIGVMQYVHNDLGCGLPEYVYQEALVRKLKKLGFNVTKEYQHHPVFDGETLDAFIKMDVVVMLPRGNVVIECKSIKELSDRERYQTHGYLRGTEFPIAILVNFGTWPKAQIEKYYYKNGKVWAF